MLGSNQGNEQGSKFPDTAQQPCKRAVQPGLLLRKEQQPWSCPQCVTDCASEADREHSGSVNKLLCLIYLSIGNNRNVCTVMTAEVVLSAWLAVKSDCSRRSLRGAMVPEDRSDFRMLSLTNKSVLPENIEPMKPINVGWRLRAYFSPGLFPESDFWPVIRNKEGQDTRQPTNLRGSNSGGFAGDREFSTAREVSC
jgi:hypothetical protein